MPKRLLIENLPMLMEVKRRYEEQARDGRPVNFQLIQIHRMIQTTLDCSHRIIELPN